MKNAGFQAEALVLLSKICFYCRHCQISHLILRNPVLKRWFANLQIRRDVGPWQIAAQDKPPGRRPCVSIGDYIGLTAAPATGMLEKIAVVALIILPRYAPSSLPGLSRMKLYGIKLSGGSGWLTCKRSWWVAAGRARYRRSMQFQAHYVRRLDRTNSHLCPVSMFVHTATTSKF